MTLSQTLSKNKNDIRQIQTSMITALDALCAIREIELQDETDRQSIALLGIREHHRDLIKETQDYITKRHVPVQLKD